MISALAVVKGMIALARRRWRGGFERQRHLSTACQEEHPMALTIMTQTIGLGFALILLVAVVLMMAYPLFLKRDFPEFEVIPGLLFLMGCWALAVGVALIVAAYQQEIISILSSPWFILPAMVLGPILFLFRTRLPFAYGLAEVAASWTIISLAIAKPADSLDPNSGLPPTRKSRQHTCWSLHHCSGP
jgi:hypothetical protein